MLEEILSLAPEQVFLIQGSDAVYRALLSEKGNHAIVTKTAPQLTIDEAGEIVRFATEGTLEKTIGIFYFTSYSSGAAELLLKALEEPHENVLVCIVTPYPYTFPQTLRSRMRIVLPQRPSLQHEALSVLHKKVESLIESKDDAPLRRASLLSFLDDVEQTAYAEKNIPLVRVVGDAKKYILAANLPPKQVAEYVRTFL